MYSLHACWFFLNTVLVFVFFAIELINYWSSHWLIDIYFIPNIILKWLLTIIYWQLFDHFYLFIYSTLK